MEVQSNEDPREVLNWFLTRAVEELEAGRNREAVWGASRDPQVVLNVLTEARRYIDMAESGAAALMREDGASWQQIGDALGISKQAAQQRLGKARVHRV